MSRPLLSAMNCCTRTFWRVLCNVSRIASATFLFGARITPMPCVPSSSLITTGCAADPLDGGQHVVAAVTNVVAGILMSWRDRIWKARSLSRELVMPFAVFGVYTSICSNCRTTAVP